MPSAAFINQRLHGLGHCGRKNAKTRCGERIAQKSLLRMSRVPAISHSLLLSQRQSPRHILIGYGISESLKHHRRGRCFTASGKIVLQQYRYVHGNSGRITAGGFPSLGTADRRIFSWLGCRRGIGLAVIRQIRGFRDLRPEKTNNAEQHTGGSHQGEQHGTPSIITALPFGM